MLLTMAVARKKPAEFQRIAPDLPSDLTILEALTSERLLSGEPIEDAIATGVDLAGIEIRSLQLVDVVLDGLGLAGATINSAHLRDVRLIHCDLSNSVWRGFEARRVEFVDCRLTGMKSMDCRWQDVLLENCDARYLQIADGIVRAGEFNGCRFDDADLRRANLEGARFSATTLSKADLSGARLYGTDLRNATLDGMIVRAEDVRGLRVNAAQALELSRLLGLVIE